MVFDDCGDQIRTQTTRRVGVAPGEEMRKEERIDLVDIRQTQDNHALLMVGVAVGG
jgi:hypothetical protein